MPVRPRLKTLVAALLVVTSLLLVYRDVLLRLVDAWMNDGNYSHGFFILPIAGYFAWMQRGELRRATVRPAWAGLGIVTVGLMALWAGLLGSELFVSRASLLITLAGSIVFIFGWNYLRILAFPLAFLVLMIPLPAIIFNRIAFPLQLLASSLGETAISAANIPVLREGNVLHLANASLEVAEACSGIRSLVSLITLAVVYGYFVDPRPWVRSLLAAAAVPVAIVANGARVAGTGIAAHYIGPEVAQGFFHEFSGWVVFVVAFLLLLATQRLIVRLAPARRPTAGAAGPGSYGIGSAPPIKGEAQ